MRQRAKKLQFESRIRKAREQAGLTQRQLADRINVDPGSISRWERGISVPLPIFEQRLADVLNISDS